MISYYDRRADPEAKFNKIFRHVKMFLLIGGTTITESNCLLKFFNNHGFKNLCISGMSLGGVLGAQVAAKAKIPVASALYYPQTSITNVWFDGVLSLQTNWKRALNDSTAIKDGIYSMSDIRNLVEDLSNILNLSAPMVP